MFGAEHGEPNRALARALGYPYAIPSDSYALVDGEIADIAAADVDVAARVLLLAYGSNAAPEVLARKVAGTPDPVPLVRTVLRDFDIVYSAHLSRYGAVPATLARSPGTEAPAFIAYLTSEQLRLVSATEPNYELAKFNRPSCTLGKGDAPSELQVYLSRHGPLLRDGAPIALSAIGAHERRFAAMTQRDVLRLVRDTLRPELSLEQFAAAVVREAERSGRAGVQLISL